MPEIYFAHDQEENPAARRLALERAGWRVRTTTDGMELLAWLRDSRPALVLLDVLVEGRNGFEVCRLLRDRHGREELPVILGCHVYQDDEHAEEALRVGAQAYVHLPVEADVLLKRIQELTGTGQRSAA